MHGRAAVLFLALAVAGCHGAPPRRAAGSISDQQASDRHEAAQEAALLAIEHEAKELQDRDAALEKRDADLQARLTRIEAGTAQLKQSAVTRYEFKEALAGLETPGARH